MGMPVKVAIIYYSATGITYELARAVREGAESAGAEVRLHRVRELASDEEIASNEGWSSHRTHTADVPEASHDDLVWADALIFGTPTRFGNVSAQLKQFIDTTGPLWRDGRLADKVVSGFVSTGTFHGGQETTLMALYTSMYHWGAIVVPPGYTAPAQWEAGNPYGASSAGTPPMWPAASGTAVRQRPRRPRLRSPGRRWPPSTRVHSSTGAHRSLALSAAARAPAIEMPAWDQHPPPPSSRSHRSGLPPSRRPRPRGRS